jgi:hypothetical protein
MLGAANLVASTTSGSFSLAVACWPRGIWEHPVVVFYWGKRHYQLGQRYLIRSPTVKKTAPSESETGIGGN